MCDKLQHCCPPSARPRCRTLLDDDSPLYTLDPERLAARFVRYFRVPGRPSLRELTILMEESGFGTVEGRHPDSMLEAIRRHWGGHGLVAKANGQGLHGPRPFGDGAP